MNSEFKAACVMGWPVAHSRSPLIHGYWIEKYGLKGTYRAEAVRPEDFPEFVATLAERGYAGGNITLPHKQSVMALSKPDERARALGAANTVWLDGGVLRSTNTDGDGFVTALDGCAPGWDKNLESAVVIGAGGASRAVVYALIDRGVQRISVVNRTLARAEAFREQFGASIRPTRWEDLPRALAGAGLVANTTSIGMVGQPDIDWDLSPVGDDTVVADVVYAPLKTSLLAAAERRGLRTSDGLGMLLYQAVRGFELWFGLRPEVTEDLRALVEAALLER